MNKILICVYAALVILLVGGGGWWSCKAGLICKSGTVSVAGEAQGTARAESVSMVVTKINSGSEASKAIDEGEAGINSLIEETKKIVGNKVEIKKGFYQLTTQANGGWMVANAISVKMSDLTKMKEAIKMFYDQGAAAVSNVAFVPQDNQKTEDDLRVEAVKKAKGEAAKIAAAGGRRLGKIVSMSDEPMSVSGTFDSLSLLKRITIIFEIR